MSSPEARPLDAGPGYAGAADRGISLAAVRAWLLLMAGLVFLMIGLGGATRLTGSGLSITEWQPILGAIPPLTDADWREAFAKYQQVPQYHALNKGMSLGEFQFIYWWEWAHRLLGRLIGIVFAVPLAYFWLRGALPKRLQRNLLGVLGLGALQGAIGWYMVKSGLVDRVDVSQYRLALHLCVAVVIFGVLLWLALDLAPEAPDSRAVASRAARRFGRLLLGLIFLQIALGALVAGLRAGLTYNTWPLMDGRLVPEGLGTLRPWYLNVFENVTTVQFDHRMVAYAILACAVWQLWSLWRSGSAEARPAAVLAVAVLAQAAIGIATLLSVVALPLAILHQAAGAGVFGVAVWHVHRLSRARA
jgi:heme a synthase